MTTFLFAWIAFIFGLALGLRLGTATTVQRVTRLVIVRESLFKHQTWIVDCDSDLDGMAELIAARCGAGRLMPCEQAAIDAVRRIVAERANS